MYEINRTVATCFRVQINITFIRQRVPVHVDHLHSESFSLSWVFAWLFASLLSMNFATPALSRPLLLFWRSICCFSPCLQRVFLFIVIVFHLLATISALTWRQMCRERKSGNFIAIGEKARTNSLNTCSISCPLINYCLKKHISFGCERMSIVCSYFGHGFVLFELWLVGWRCKCSF